MRRPESPKWGVRSVERWVKETAARMKRGEVERVTFEGVWRGGVKRRFLTNARSTAHRAVCVHVMKLGEQWDPPPDRIQARLWSPDKRYLGSLTWQINARPRPRPLQRGELPQKQGAPSVAKAQAFEQTGAEAAVGVEKRLRQLESASASPTPEQLAALNRRLEKLEGRLSATEEENRRLREAIEVVWKELSEPVLTDVYRRLQVLYEKQDLDWKYPISPVVLPEKWPNITSD